MSFLMKFYGILLVRDLEILVNGVMAKRASSFFRTVRGDYGIRSCMPGLKLEPRKDWTARSGGTPSIAGRGLLTFCIQQGEDTPRPQSVKMENFTTSTKTLKTRAPQGCALSPLLYSLYTHDSAAKFRTNVIYKFADDALCKTKELVTDFRQKGGEHAPIYINGAEVERVESVKFLRVTITDNLSWTSHIDAMVKKTHQRLFFLRWHRKFGMSTRSLTDFYRCTIESILP
eukprot:g45283.t1